MKCTLCGSGNVTKTTCPLNNKAINSHPKKHYMINKKLSKQIGGTNNITSQEKKH